MYCGNCGAKNDDGNDFCIQCGANLKQFMAPGAPGAAPGPAQPSAHYSLSRPSGRLFCIPPGPGNTIGDDPAGSLADRPGRPFRPASSEGPGGVAAGDGSPRQATDRDVPGDGPTAS